MKNIPLSCLLCPHEAGQEDQGGWTHATEAPQVVTDCLVSRFACSAGGLAMGPKVCRPQGHQQLNLGGESQPLGIDLDWIVLSH